MVLIVRILGSFMHSCFICHRNTGSSTNTAKVLVQVRKSPKLPINPSMASSSHAVCPKVLYVWLIYHFKCYLYLYLYRLYLIPHWPTFLQQVSLSLLVKLNGKCCNVIWEIGRLSLECVMNLGRWLISRTFLLLLEFFYHFVGGLVLRCSLQTSIKIFMWLASHLPSVMMADLIWVLHIFLLESSADEVNWDTLIVYIRVE